MSRVIFISAMPLSFLVNTDSGTPEREGLGSWVFKIGAEDGKYNCTFSDPWEWEKINRSKKSVRLASLDDSLEIANAIAIFVEYENIKLAEGETEADYWLNHVNDYWH